MNLQSSIHGRIWGRADTFIGVLSITPMKAYLLAYNVISTALWLQILLLTISYILTPHDSPTIGTTNSKSLIAPFLRYFNLGTGIDTSSNSVLTRTHTPKIVIQAMDHLRGSYHFMGLGTWVKVTQTLAVLDVVHAALGLVKSNVGTAASQVFSRLWAVWGVVEMVPEVCPSLALRHHSQHHSRSLSFSLSFFV